MPTPRLASRWLNHAVLVSTRSPSRISVPMVTISALLRLFSPSCILLFYNPCDGSSREERHPPRIRRRLRPRPALGEALRSHSTSGRHGGASGARPRPRPGPHAARLPPARRRERDGAGGVSSVGREVECSGRRTGAAEPEAIARARGRGAGATGAGGRRRGGSGGDPG